MANRLPEPHSPLRALIFKVALWGGILSTITLFDATASTAIDGPRREEVSSPVPFNRAVVLAAVKMLWDGSVVR